MSRAYWVKLASSVSTTVKADDRAIHKIELDAVVPEGEMSELLEGALGASGWERSSEHPRRFTKESSEGVELTWDLDAGTVEASAEASRQVVRDVEVQGRGYSQDVAQVEAERQLATRERAALEEAKIEEERLQRQVTEQLGANEQDRVREINEVLQKTYAEAIKRKAQRLGTVTSVHESQQGGDYSLTIVISE
jgi:hypothetical protein